MILYILETTILDVVVVEMLLYYYYRSITLWLAQLFVFIIVTRSYTVVPGRLEILLRHL